jgi:hypothetical protein
MSDVIYTPPASGGGGTTINPTNNFIPLRSNATTFIDSNIENIQDNYLRTKYNSFPTGIYIDFPNNNYQFGEFTGNILGQIALQIVPNSLNFTDVYTGINFFTINNINSTGNINFTIDADTSIIKTISNYNDIGLKLDFLNAEYYLGDFLYQNNGTRLEVLDSIEVIRTKWQNYDLGIYLDMPNRIITIGDINGDFNGTKIYVDDINRNISTHGSGLFLDFANQLYQFGDFYYSNNGNSFWIDDLNNLMRTYSSGNRNGLQFDFGAKTYSLGDFDTINNGTAIFIEDNNENITFRSNNQITFQGNNLQDNNPRTYSGRNIVVKSPSGGTFYLPLYQ